MLRNQSFTKLWKKDEPRENRMIFIGRDMQQRRQELTEGFMACSAEKPLRFEVGAKVRTKIGEGDDDFALGTVVKHWDEMHAYRVKLDDGDDESHAPIDSDAYIKAP
jgi:hypothetical protein